MKNALIAVLALSAGVAVMPAIGQQLTAPDQNVVADAPADFESELLAQGPSSVAQIGGGGHKFEKKFPLSDEQLEKMHSLKSQYSTATSAKKAELINLRSQLRDALSAVTVDKTAALALQGKISAIQSDLAASKVSFMADASSIFTAEQRQEFRRRMLAREAMGGFKKHHRGHGKGHFGGGGCSGGKR